MLKLDPYTPLGRSSDWPGIVVVPVGIQIHTQSIDCLRRTDALDVQCLIFEGEFARADNAGPRKNQSSEIPIRQIVVEIFSLCACQLWQRKIVFSIISDWSMSSPR